MQIYMHFCMSSYLGYQNDAILVKVKIWQLLQVCYAVCSNVSIQLNKMLLKHSSKLYVVYVKNTLLTAVYIESTHILPLVCAVVICTKPATLKL